MDVRSLLRSIKEDPVRRNIVLLINAGGILFGFVYYQPQFAATPVWLWPLVPDSPFAVAVAAAALLLWGVGRPVPAVDTLAYLYMAKVGLWTAFVLAWHPEHFGFSYLGTGLNTVLFYLHLGMAAQALVYLVDLKASAAVWAGALAWLVFNDWADYGWTGYVLPGRDCPGLFPYTVPCTDVGLVAAVTVGLSVGLVAAGFAFVKAGD